VSLSLSRVSVTRGRAHVLRELSLDIDDGEWLAVVGGTGSGRTTLAHVVSGLRRPRFGRVALDGLDIWRRGGQASRRRLGLVMQRAEDQFLGETVFEDTAFGPRQTFRQTELVDAAVDRALRLVGFDPAQVGSRSPHAFSGGQRRRLAVAGLLALEPSVLVLDEPFAGLDGDARVEMIALLLGLRERGTAIVTLTSDIESVAGAGRMALLVNGEIGLTGHLRDLVANQRLCEEAGVTLPDNVRLSLELRKRGWNVPVLGPPGALEESIAREWGLRKRA